MRDYVTLLGAEQVQSAATTMMHAADRMQHPANAMLDAADRHRDVASRIEHAFEMHQRFLDGWLMRLQDVMSTEKK